MDLRRTDLLLAAIARGDALGVTADGASAADAARLRRAHGDRGWPLRPVGSDELGPGQTTRVTAQARAVLRAFVLAGGRFDGAAFARELRQFAASTRRPLEPALHRALADLDAGCVWWRAGERARRERPAAEPPSDEVVTRAIPLATLVVDERQALVAAMLQALATDWSHDAVVGAAQMVFLCRRALAGGAPWHDGDAVWHAAFAAALATVSWPEPLVHWCATAGPLTAAAPHRVVTAAVAAARIAAGAAPPDPDLAALAAALPAATGEQAFALLAAAGGPACAATAAAAALLAATAAPR